MTEVKTEKMSKTKLIRTATVPISLRRLLTGQLRFLSENGFEVLGVSSPGKELEEVNRVEGVRTKALGMSRKIAPFRDLKSLWLLCKLFRQEKPQIVHSITPKAGLLSMLAAKVANVPIRMHTYTGLIFPSKTGILQKVLINMDRLLCWAATNVYPEGNGVKQDLIKYKITHKPLKVLANGNVNGIDSVYFSPDKIGPEQRLALKKDIGIRPNDFVFIFVGRLVADKGINELVIAFQELEVGLSSFDKKEAMSADDAVGLEDNQQFNQERKPKLLLVGDQEKKLDPLLPETIEKIENNPNIIGVGYQTDVRPYFAVSDCLVFPSYREGFPNVVIQAGAMGLPSIVTDINGSNEIIKEDINGVIIPPKDVDSLKGVMMRMMKDEKWCLSVKKNAREMIVSRYEQREVWEAVLQEYQCVLMG